MAHRVQPARTIRNFMPVRLLISVQIIIAFLMLAALLPGIAAAQQGVQGVFAYDTPEGKLVIPLPDGSWRKVLVHETHEVINMGTYSDDWTKGNVFLIRAKAGKVDAVVTVNANLSGIDGRRIAPPDFCYEKQRSWKYHKQYKVLPSDTYCWGVNSAHLPITAESEEEAWQLFMEKNEASKWGIANDAPATQVRFLRWVNGRFVRIDYYFLAPKGAKPVDWKAARDWAKGLVGKVKSGFEGG